MSKNNDFDSDRRRPELDEYLSKEITQYYGEDVISGIESSSAPIPPKRRRNSRLLSALGIICAVMFLTGAVIFSGVFLTSGISGFENNTHSDTFSGGIVSELFTDTDTLSSKYESDNNINSDTDTADTDYRTDYFSLPEYPDEGNISEIDTDVNNNSSTNPNDNVTTGKNFRSKIGIILMILSLITVYALYHIKNNKEY